MADPTHDPVRRPSRSRRLALPVLLCISFVFVLRMAAPLWIGVLLGTLSAFSLQGMYRRLSAKLGEGVVNGLMTARIGLSAMDVCRPLPFLAAERPRLKDLAGNLMSPGEGG